jgi:Flp pilus assembly protein TadG
MSHTDLPLPLADRKWGEKMNRKTCSKFVSWLRRGRAEEGQAMVMVALSLVVMLGFGAFAVDLGHVAVVKSDLQNAADAAALAGVVDSDKVNTAVKYAQDNGMDVTAPFAWNKGDRVDPTPIGTKQLKVQCSREVDYYFAGVLGFESTTVTAVAVAEMNSTAWAGDALPFLNCNMPYSNGQKIIVRDKAWGGSFDSINKDDRGLKGKGANWIFDIGYEDGIIIKNGKDNSIQKTVEQIHTGDGSGIKTVVYLFSIPNELQQSPAKVKLMNGTSKLAKNLTNNDVVSPDQLVLLKCTFDNCTKNSLDVDFTVIGMYDLGNDYSDGSGNNLPDYPTDYISPIGEGAGAHLIL